MRKESHTIYGIDNTDTWFFRIRAIDYFENVGPWSNTVSNLLPGHSPPDTILILNFGEIIVLLENGDGFFMILILDLVFLGWALDITIIHYNLP